MRGWRLWRRRPWYRAGWLAGLFLGASVVWILGSDRLLRVLVADPDMLTALQSVKGLFFVAVTAVFILVAVGRELARRHRAERGLRDALARERELTDRLSRLDELKDEFLLSVSHELRTPLTSVLGFARTLREKGTRVDTDRHRSFLDAIVRNAERLEWHVTRLLDTKRLGESFHPPDLAPTDLAEIARFVAERMETAEHPISVEDRPAIVEADPVHMVRLLEHLLDNVARHTPLATVARIRFVERSEEVEIHVEDDGPGIPDNRKEQVFRAFEKGAPLGHSPGLGLGLFLVEKYVRQHRGYVRAENGRGGGTRIRVVLPKEPSVAGRRPPEPVRSEPRGDREPRIEGLARDAGLRGVPRLTPATTTRRRRELGLVLAAALVVLPAAVVTFEFEITSAWVPAAMTPVVRVAVVALGLVLAAYAVEKERAIRRLERALAEEQALRGSIEASLQQVPAPGGASESGGGSVFRRVADEALRLLDADHASILVVRGPQLVVAAEVGKTRNLLGESGSFERGIAGYVARTGRPLLLRDDIDVVEVAANLGQPVVREGPPPRSAVCVPVRLGGEVAAVLNVNILEGSRRFEGEDLRLLTIFSQEAEGLLGTELLAEQGA